MNNLTKLQYPTVEVYISILYRNKEYYDNLDELRRINESFFLSEIKGKRIPSVTRRQTVCCINVIRNLLEKRYDEATRELKDILTSNKRPYTRINENDIMLCHIVLSLLDVV